MDINERNILIGTGEYEYNDGNDGKDGKDSKCPVLKSIDYGRAVGISEDKENTSYAHAVIEMLKTFAGLFNRYDGITASQATQDKLRRLLETLKTSSHKVKLLEDLRRSREGRRTRDKYNLHDIAIEVLSAP